LSAFEFYSPDNVVITYGRIFFVMLQGTWFYQAGFILYPPKSFGKGWVWDPENHEQIMKITSIYCWHILLISIGLLLQFFVIKLVLLKASRNSNPYFFPELMTDNENHNEYFNKNIKNSELKFLRIESDDEDSTNDNVEYDGTKLIPRKNIKNSDTTVGSSSSGHSSGNYQIDGNNDTLV
jgi:hypothetical protein